MLIRRMAAGDLPAVAALSGQLGYPTTPADLERRLHLLAADAEHGLFVAEEPGGGVVGWVHVHGRHLLEAEPFAEIGGLVVGAACRGQGVGQALMAEAEAWALCHGYRDMRVRSNTIRAEAHGFYRHLGYRQVKSQHVFGKPLGPAGEADSPAHG